MNLLLDTHALLWWMEAIPNIGRRQKCACQLKGRERFGSAPFPYGRLPSKLQLGRLDPFDPLEDWTRKLVNELGFRSLPVTFAHAFAVRHLPLHHADPFDRLLIAQAQCENLTLLTADPWMDAYDVRTIDASA